MTNNDTTSDGESVRGVSRRRYLTGVGSASTLALAGYVGRPATAQQISVQMAMPPPVTNNADATREALRNAGLPDNIQVEFLTTSEITGDVRSQFRQWLSAGRNKPDIFRMDSGWTIPFIARNQLVNLSERLSDESLSLIEEQYFDASVNTASGRDGNLYGVPWQVGFPTVQYRKDVIESSGFDPESENWATEPMSWENFGEIIAQSHDQSDIEFGYAWQGNDYGGLSCCTFNEFMSSWGGAYFGGRENLFGPVGDRPVTVDEEPVLDALRMARTFVQGTDDEFALEGFQNISPEAVLQWTEGPSSTAFMDGNAMALRYWPSTIPQGVETFGDDFGVMPLPYGIPEGESEHEGLGGSTPALGGWHLTVNPNSNNVDAAVQVIEATIQQSFREFEFGELGFLTGDRRLFDPDVAPDTWAPYMETLRIAGENAVPRPVTVVWPDQSPLISSEINRALSGQKAPDQALSDLQGSLEEVEASV
ncbi:extracellular solute-binding protein [Halorussus litoreus]|uniref:extracellular solute-binding protein n=1 Tax=Halorussus litoreus TaxID=1710536 RepID=UPI000E26115A|nr:extracellular solute-binding protein [Halorussus litoreus]